MTLGDYERGVTYTTSSSSSWYSHDVRRPVSWQLPDIDEMPCHGPSTYSVHGVHPVAVDYSTVAPDAAAAAGGWSLVDLKPCLTTCGLSTYTGKRQRSLITWRCMFVAVYNVQLSLLARLHTV